MASRKDLKKQKEKTSQALIQAALQLCAEEGYASLSLRSVARKAGIAPTSFYRHFREIDEMGVEIVAQAKTVLEDCLAKAAKKMAFPANKKGASPADLVKSIEGMTRPFAETFINGFKANPQQLHLFFQEGTGSSGAMRLAVADATDQLTESLCETLAHLRLAPKKNSGDTRLMAEAMLTVASRSGMEMLVHPETKPGDITARTVRKLNHLLLGALIMEQTRQGAVHE